MNHKNLRAQKFLHGLFFVKIFQSMIALDELYRTVIIQILRMIQSYVRNSIPGMVLWI